MKDFDADLIACCEYEAGELEGRGLKYRAANMRKVAAALSHAAGQEAVAWITPCDLDAVIDCDDDRGFVTRLFGVTGEQLIPLYITPAATTNPAEIGRKSVGGGQEAVAWRTIKPCGLRRHMTQAQYDANPNVQKWYEPFKCADCRAPAQPPAGADQVDWRYTAVSALEYLRANDPPEAQAMLESAMAASSGRKGGQNG